MTCTDGGFTLIGTVSSAYRPAMIQIAATTINIDLTGQIYETINVLIATDGKVYLLTGTKTALGNSTYSWTTNNGLSFTYHL